MRQQLFNQPMLLVLLVCSTFASTMPATAQSVTYAGTITVAPAKRTPRISSFCLSPDTKTLAVCVSLSDPSEIWLSINDTDTLKEISKHKIPRWRRCVYTPDGKSIVATVNGTSKGLPLTQRILVQVYDAVTLKLRYELNLAESECWGYFAVTPDGKTIVCPGINHVLLVDLETGKPRTRLPGPGKPWHVTVSPNSKYATVTDLTTRVITIYDLPRGKITAEVSTNNRGYNKTYFTPDSKALGYDRDSVRFLDPTNGKEVSVIKHSTDRRGDDIRVTKDGKWLVCAGCSGEVSGVYVESLEGFKPLRPELRGQGYFPSCGVVSPDGDLAVVSRLRDDLRLYRIETLPKK